MADKKSRVWLITGCSRGIGQAIAKEALRNGDYVVATARDLDDVAALTKGHPMQCSAVKLDLLKPEQIEHCVHQAIDRHGRIDVLVNNAGYGLQGVVEEVTMDQIRKQMEVNFFGLVHMTKEVLPHMRKQGSGFIFNISSMAGLRGMPSFSIYNSSKFAVNGFSEAVSKEMKDFGVFVTAVEPGPYRTDWAGDSLDRAEAIKTLSEESPYRNLNAQLKQRVDKNSGKQPGNPRQIAQVLVDAVNEGMAPVHMLFGDVAIESWKDQKKRFEDQDFFREYPHEKLDV